MRKDKSLVIGGAALFVLGLLATPVRGESWIVKEGQPQAEIVIAEKPPRMVKLAAEELQAYIEKITGAKLAITNAPGKNVPVHIYVGRSPETDKLKITDEGLKHGAFKMVSGENWLALVGHDSDYTPSMPYFLGGGLPAYPAWLKEWDADLAARAHQKGFDIGDNKWFSPYRELFLDHSSKMGIWNQDERGSLNAVYAFLRDQGVRWYMPGDIGEIVPKKATVTFSQVDKTVRPDFALRQVFQYGRQFYWNDKNEILWQLRLGFNKAPDVIGSDYGVGIGHGICPVIGREETQKAHPEYYAKNPDGTRIFMRDGRYDPLPCLSSPGLFESNVKYIRALFDLYNEPIVSVMMPDAFLATCQCKLCKDKGTPERGSGGSTSDYVWDYVNRIAKEVYKTHPDKKISCCTYNSYTLPPTRIDQLSPNIVVGLCQWRLNAFSDFAPKKKEETIRFREEWLKKIPKGHVLFYVYEYYRYAVPGFPTQFMPVYFPHAIAADLRSLKGISMGEYIEVHRQMGDNKADCLGVTHLNLYVTSQFLWDAEQDVDKMLGEYYTLFYGPAAAEMKAFVDYSEAHWMELGKQADRIDQVLTLLEKAQKKVDAKSVYARRIKLIADYIRPLNDLKNKIAAGRGPMPEACGFVRDASGLKLDGKLDDVFWQGLEKSGAKLESYTLRKVTTGQPARFRTSFKVAYAGDNLYLGIECKDAERTALTNAPMKHDDMAIFDINESVEILMETQNHSYYHLAISPAGEFLDVDWKKGILDTRWNSNAEVSTHVDEDSWSAEIRIPIFPPTQEDILPLVGVAGEKPSEAYPWYFNLCRSGLEEGGGPNLL